MDWTEKEEQEILMERRKKKISKPALEVLKSRFTLIFFMIFLLEGSFILHGNIPIAGFRDYFPATWICGNCGYDNYEGINYCGVCGEKKS